MNIVLFFLAPVFFSGLWSSPDTFISPPSLADIPPLNTDPPLPLPVSEISLEPLPSETTSFFLPDAQTANLKMMVFLTLSCPACRDFFHDTLEPLRKALVKKNLSVSLELILLPEDPQKESSEAFYFFSCLQKNVLPKDFWMALSEWYSAVPLTDIVEKSKTEEVSACLQEKKSPDLFSSAFLLAEEHQVARTPTVVLGYEYFFGTIPPENLIWKIEQHLKNTQ